MTIFANYQERLDGLPKIDCVPSCMNARKEECTCRCGGANHGLRGMRNGDHVDPTLSNEQAKPFLDQVTDWRCICGADLRGLPVSYYPHDAGWTVKDIEEDQWLYIVCEACGYQMALWKMGVKR